MLNNTVATQSKICVKTEKIILLQEANKAIEMPDKMSLWY